MEEAVDCSANFYQVNKFNKIEAPDTGNSIVFIQNNIRLIRKLTFNIQFQIFLYQYCKMDVYHRFVSPTETILHDLDISN